MARRWHRAAWLLPLVVILPLGLVALVTLTTQSYRYDDPALVPQQRVALVFGAGVRPDGTPTRMLADRVRAGAQLYLDGRVDKLLMSGDNSSVAYDEVSAMRRYAEQLGVPPEDITLDYAGFSTYESCYRARDIFGVQSAVLVTQRFHLPRAVYTCRALGIDASGVGTPDWGAYRAPVILRYRLREALATLNALWQLHVTRPLPTFLGPFEGIR